MTEKEMLQTIIGRAKEMATNPIVINKVKEMYLSGKTVEDCQNWVYQAAVATLYGNKAA